MLDKDAEWLYRMVPDGTMVIIHPAEVYLIKASCPNQSPDGPSAQLPSPPEPLRPRYNSRSHRSSSPVP
ncbi:MAG: L,D-transpeptidase [Bianqueaceae bacterium]